MENASPVLTSGFKIVHVLLPTFKNLHIYTRIEIHIEIGLQWGTWVAQSVERPASAQVMISRFVGSSPMSGSVLTAQSLEPASDSVFPSLSAQPPLVPVSLCLKNK